MIWDYINDTNEYTDFRQFLIISKIFLQNITVVKQIFIKSFIEVTHYVYVSVIFGEVILHSLL